MNPGAWRATLLWLAFLTSVVSAADLQREEIWSHLKPFFDPPAIYRGDFGPCRSPLKFDDGRDVRAPADWPKRRVEILNYWKSVLGPWPDLIENPRLVIEDKKKRDNFLQYRVQLEIAPDRMEEAYLLTPEGPGPFPAVLVPYYEPLSSIGLTNVLRDFAYQLTRRGFVTLSIGSPGGDARKPVLGEAKCQPLYFLAYVAANGCNALRRLPQVDPERIGIVGHSYGAKWAMFASCFYEKFACAVWSDGGIIFDESKANVNYWEPWYLGQDPARQRTPGLVTRENPRTGAYGRLIEEKHDLNEIQALMAPRPFLVSGGSEDTVDSWRILNHSIAVNTLLGSTNRVGMTNRKGHMPTVESNEQIYQFFEYFLKNPPNSH